MYRLSIIGFLTFLFISPSYSNSLHTIQTGDTLSHIAWKYIGTPIYKEHGSLKKLLNWNPQVVNSNLIKAGEILVVSPPVKTVSVIDPMANEVKSSDLPETSTEKQNPSLLDRQLDEPDLQKQSQSYLNSDSPLKIDLALGTSYFSILSQTKFNSKSVYLYSDASIDIATQFHFLWSSHLKSLIGAAFSLSRFSHNGPQQIENQRTSKVSIFTGVQKTWGRFSVGPNIIYSQNFFLKNRSDTILEIVSNPTISPSLFASYLALKNSHYSLSPGLEVQKMIPIDFLEYSYTKGNKWKVLLEHRRNFIESQLGLTVFYSEEKHETQEVIQKERQLSLMLNYLF